MCLQGRGAGTNTHLKIPSLYKDPSDPFHAPVPPWGCAGARGNERVRAGARVPVRARAYVCAPVRALGCAWVRTCTCA